MEIECVKSVLFKQKCETGDIPSYAVEYEKLMSVRSKSAKKVYTQNQWTGTTWSLVLSEMRSFTQVHSSIYFCCS